MTFPEISVIDTVSGQIEAQCRDLVAHIQVTLDFKNVLLNAVRPTLLLEKVLQIETPPYLKNVFPSENFQKIQSLIKIQKESLKEINEQVNTAILRETSNLFENENSLLSQQRQTQIVLDDELKQEFGKFTQKHQQTIEGQTSLTEFKNVLIMQARSLCNRAHQLQNEASFFIRYREVNDLSNQIINQAGQLENRTRKIQQILVNFQPQSSYDIQHIKNIQKQIKVECDESLKHLEIINGVLAKENCPVKQQKDSLVQNIVSLMPTAFSILSKNAEIDILVHQKNQN